MDIDYIFTGIYPANIDSKTRTYLPSSFKTNLKEVMVDSYHLLISKETAGASKLLVFEPILKDVYEELKEEAIEVLEMGCLSGKVKAEVKKQGTVTLTTSLVDFLNSQEGENYYFVGCGEHCELHKSEKNYTEFFNMIVSQLNQFRQ